ncbi:MAG: Crp/Fnr family transcriptional regulator [Bacteroidota bacterium]
MLYDYFKGFGELPDNEMDYLLSHCTLNEIRKGDVLITPHHHVDSIYFLEKGYLHYYTYTDLGERVTLKVVSPNVCWTVMESFMNQIPTENECIALTDVRFCEFKRKDYLAIKEKSKSLSNFISRIVEQVLSLKVIEANNKSKMTVEERYLHLLQTNPEMIREVPVSIIASLIGTSRETLHRIRRRLTAA